MELTYASKDTCRQTFVTNQTNHMLCRTCSGTCPVHEKILAHSKQFIHLLYQFQSSSSSTELVSTFGEGVDDDEGLLGIKTGLSSFPVSSGVNPPEKLIVSSSSSSRIEGGRSLRPSRTGESNVTKGKYRAGLCGFCSFAVGVLGADETGPSAPVRDPNKLVEALVTSEKRTDARLDDLENLCTQRK